MVHASGHARSRCPYVAVGIVAFVFCAQHSYAQGTANQKGHSDQADKQYCQPAATTCVEPNPYQLPQNCNHPKSYEEANLCVERRAAKAAEDQAIWARHTFWIGFWGTAFVILTLIATSIAAWAAQRSAKAADKTLEHARESAERQLRAYVDVVSCAVQDVEVGKRPCAMVIVKNAGQTPAKDFVGHGQINIVWTTKGTEFPSVELNGIGRRTIGSQADHHFQGSLSLALTQEDMEALEADHMRIVIYGRMEYCDVWGVKRETAYRIYRAPRSSNLISYDDGNYST